MKVVTLILAVTMVAGAASSVIWSEDFSSPTVFDPNSNPFNVWDDNAGGGTTMQWNEANAIVGAEQLVNTSGTTGQNRGVAYVLDPSEISGGIAAGDYTLKFDITDMLNGTVMGVSVYDGTRDDTGSVNTYRIDLLSAAASPLVHVNAGTGSLDLLESATYNDVDHEGTTVQLDFTYDGTGDIVMVWDLPSSTTQRAYTIDNVEIIPEPATIGLMAVFGVGIFFSRRRKSS